jgi:hypothetical protein
MQLSMKEMGFPSVQEKLMTSDVSGEPAPRVADGPIAQVKTTPNVAVMTEVFLGLGDGILTVVKVRGTHEHEERSAKVEVS